MSMTTSHAVRGALLRGSVTAAVLIGVLGSCQTERVSPTPGPRLAFVAQPTDVTVGDNFGPNVQVAVLDGTGNTMTSATNSVTLAITAGTGASGATLAGVLTQ